MPGKGRRIGRGAGAAVYFIILILINLIEFIHLFL